MIEMAIPVFILLVVLIALLCFACFVAGALLTAIGFCAQDSENARKKLGLPEASTEG